MKQRSNSVAKGFLRDEATLPAQALEPAHPDRHVPDLLRVDMAQDRGARCVAGAFEPLGHPRRHVEPARLEHQRHDRETGEQIVGGRLGRLP